VQQREGRVQPTKQGKSKAVNDNPSLESEADNMGKKAANGQQVDVAGKGSGVQKQVDEDWGSLGNKNPALHSETLDVAKNELTWDLKHATVKYWAEVTASGSISIQYRLNDRLDLSSSPGRSGAYNIISDILGFGYHTTAGGNINLQTRAEWTVNF
jgi:hypothetical protein